MRLLIFTESFTYGGLETYIVNEIKQLKRRGYDIYFCVGKVYDESLIRNLGICDILQVDLDGYTNATDLQKIVDKITRYVNDNEIDVLHIHPFISIVPGYLVAASAGIPAVCTLHGPASIGGVYGSFFDKATQTALKEMNSIVVVSNELKNTLANLSIDSVLLPNAVDFSGEFKASRSSDSKHWRWMVVSRLDEMKTVGIYDFVKKIHKFGYKSIDIIGDGPAKDDLINKFDTEGIERVNFKGRIDNVKIYTNYDAIGGMGRVTLEAIAAGMPVCLIGYDGVKGMVDEGNLSSHAQNNFSGRDREVLEYKEFSQNIANYRTSVPDVLREKIKPDHDIVLSWWKFDIIARNTRALKKNRTYKTLKETVYSEDSDQPWYIRDN